MAVAHREGRTLIVVTLNVPDHYGVARVLLDRGFTTPPPSAPYDRLPPVRPLRAPSTVSMEGEPGPPPLTPVAVASAGPPSRQVQAASAGLSLSLAVAMLAWTVAIRRRHGARGKANPI